MYFKTNIFCILYILLHWVRISSDALKVAARNLKRSAALYTQPHHLRVVAVAEGGVGALLPVCERVLNGELPERAARWVYAQKVVALSKMSHHQADIEARVVAQKRATVTPTRRQCVLSGWEMVSCG